MNNKITVNGNAQFSESGINMSAGNIIINYPVKEESNLKSKKADIRSKNEETPVIKGKIFIVHGRDRALVYELKNYLQNTLKYPEPIVLSETASKGQTIIECFETETENTGLVFVLLTPDDWVNDDYKQARPNVFIELGYFMGKLGRQSGRIIILVKGELKMPTDLAGIRYIQINNSISEAGEDIRRELNDMIR